MADLVFSRPRYTGGPVDLVFGDSGGTGGGDSTVTITATFSAMTFQAVVAYDNRNPRRASTIARLPHQVAARALPETRVGWGTSRQDLREERTTWQQAGRAARETDTGWNRPGRIVDQRAVPWVLAVPAGTLAAFAHQAAEMLRAQALLPWQVAAALHATSRAPHKVGLQVHTDRVVPWLLAARLQALASGGRQVAAAAGLTSLWPWDVARVIPPGREVWPPVDPGTVTPRVPSTHLVFACPPWTGGPVNLVFGRVCVLPPPEPGAPLQILPARYYMIVHSLTAVRLPDLSSVPIFNVDLSADAGSFCWKFSATGPRTLFDQLAPVAGLPARIRITLDGIPFVFLIESIAEDHQFGSRVVRISGRSATALLGRPWRREETHANPGAPATAQQLALQALDATGVDLDWGLTDWLVPASAWSHLGTPLSAVQLIAEAAGGYLQSHRSAETLMTRHPYPELAGGMVGGPWNWYHPDVTPDVELAPDALVTTAVERRDGDDLNAVYVSGTTHGVLALVRRTGSAGDKLGQLVTDQLMTTQEVALQRGLSVLGAAGPKHLVQVSLPVLTGVGQPGVLDVGQLVQINTSSPWRGRVRGVSVSAALGQSVRQSVAIERHLEVA